MQPRSSRREEARTLFAGRRMSLLTSAATRIDRPQRFQHVGVITERQRRMQSADDVQLRDAELQRLARLLHDLLRGELEAVGVALLPRERAELAGENAVVRVVDVA